MSPGLQRAREPFRFRNALTGVALGLFAFGVYSYSIRAVKQDSFDDIDEEAKALARTGTPSGTAALPSPDSTAPLPMTTNSVPPTLNKEQEKKIMQNAFDVATGVGPSKAPLKQDQSTAVPTSPPHPLQKRGVLQKLDGKFPGLLDPQNKTLVWGAPPIDNVGRISSK